jgi:hypothetical protein
MLAGIRDPKWKSRIIGPIPDWITKEPSMAFLDHEGGADYPYPRNVVFEAIIAAIPRVGGMEIQSADELSGRIVAKAGVSPMSWGENIPIEVSESAPGHTCVRITSTPKTGALFGGAFDLGKNRKNIERILTALSESLRNVPFTAVPFAARDSRSEVAERLVKLKDLADKGLVTAAEFEKRKAEILSEL